MEKENLVSFLLEMEKFKTIYRDTKNPDGRNESDAEHTWTLSLLILILEKELKEREYDVSKMLRLSLIHDLPEIYAGDLNPYVDDLSQKKEKEAASTKEILSLLPQESKNTMGKLFEEYEGQDSKESRLVRSLDKILPMISTLASSDKYSCYKDIKATKEDCKKYCSRFIIDDISKELIEYVYELSVKNKVFYGD